MYLPHFGSYPILTLSFTKQWVTYLVVYGMEEQVENLKNYLLASLMILVVFGGHFPIVFNHT